MAKQGIVESMKCSSKCAKFSAIWYRLGRYQTYRVTLLHPASIHCVILLQDIMGVVCDDGIQPVASVIVSMPLCCRGIIHWRGALDTPAHLGTSGTFFVSCPHLANTVSPFLLLASSTTVMESISTSLYCIIMHFVCVSVLHYIALSWSHPLYSYF